MTIGRQANPASSGKKAGRRNTLAAVLIVALLIGVVGTYFYSSRQPRSLNDCETVTQSPQAFASCVNQFATTHGNTNLLTATTTQVFTPSYGIELASYNQSSNDDRFISASFLLNGSQVWSTNGFHISSVKFDGGTLSDSTNPPDWFIASNPSTSGGSCIGGVCTIVLRVAYSPSTGVNTLTIATSDGASWNFSLNLVSRSVGGLEVVSVQTCSSSTPPLTALMLEVDDVNPSSFTNISIAQVNIDGTSTAFSQNKYGPVSCQLNTGAIANIAGLPARSYTWDGPSSPTGITLLPDGALVVNVNLPLSSATQVTTHSFAIEFSNGILLKGNFAD